MNDGQKASSDPLGLYRKKVLPEELIYKKIRRGDHIFFHTACGEPQALVKGLIDFIEKNPQSFVDTELFQVWTLGVAPYTDEKYKRFFRHNSFFVGNSTRTAINSGLADYTPVFLSQIPELFRKDHIPVDVAFIQTSLPDSHGYVSLGVSVDIVMAAIEKARLVIAQVNKFMPRVHGDGFIHLDQVDCILHRDEPLLEYSDGHDTGVVQEIGKYVSRLIQDGDTIQVGYGSIPNAILGNLNNKKDLGVHTELLSDGLVNLIRKSVVTNKFKKPNRGKTIATFCMGHQDTYDFLHDNPSIVFRTVDYTNDPIVIAAHENMTAINSALEIDLTGQATAESLGSTFYSGIGGQADFMRGAILSKGGKTILTLPSAAENGKVSRIVPFLREGAGVTLNRGDIHYVVTEYGIAYIHGKNIRERAMALISIAHPDFREELLNKAKDLKLIFKDQAFVTGTGGRYPEQIETRKTSGKGIDLFLRPVKINDEPILKDFFYNLSDQTMYKRFISQRKDMPHERLQDYVAIDYSNEMIVLAFLSENTDKVAGLGQYQILEGLHIANVSFIVSDEYQNQGIGRELLTLMTLIAKRQGLLGFTAEVLMDNARMMHLFKSMGFDLEQDRSDGMYELKMLFK